jgi:outer membrane protein TolC
MRGLLLLAGAAVLSGGPAVLARAQTPPAPERWDLARFERESLARHLAIREAEEDVRLGAARRMEAAWARFPRFEWVSVAAPIPTLQGDPLRTQTPTNQFVGFSGVWQQHKVDISVPLFTFGKIRNATRAAEAGTAAARHNVERARAEVLRDVRRAYYSVQVAREVLKVIKEGQERLVSAEKKLEELLEKGAKEVEELDKNRLATFSAEVSTRREEAVKFAELSRYAVRVAAGLRQSAPVEVAPGRLEMVKVSVPPLNVLIDTALGERPEVKALGAGLRARRSLVALQESFYYPDFFIAGTVGVARCNVCSDQVSPFAFDPFNLDLYGAVLGIRLTLDYAQKVARVRQAEAELRKLEAQRERATEGIRLEVRNAYLEWVQAKRQMEIIRKGRKSAQGWLIQSTINFSTGLIKVKDLTDALAAWFKFRLEELRSVYNYNVAVANLATVTGRELPRVAK